MRDSPKNEDAVLKMKRGGPEARLRQERTMIALAIAELDAGRGVRGDALKSWLTAWERGDELPPLQGATTP